VIGRGHAPALLAVVALAGSAALAQAATKSKPTLYRGKVGADRVLVSLAPGAARVTFTLTCRGRALKIENLRVSKLRRFSGARNEAGAAKNPVATVHGQFAGKRTVKGTYTTTSVKCARKSATWRARRG
jgi:hypothetical protein